MEILNITLPIMFIAIAAAVLAALIVPFYLHNRAKDRARLYEMLRQAQESSHPFSPDLIRQIVGGPPPSREKDIRRGAVLLATAVGIAIPTVSVFVLITSLRGRMFEEILPRASDILMFLSVFALIGSVISVLGCVGATLLVLGLTRKRPDKNLAAKDLPAKD
jgi:predicted anti-sigma-YlaC factor YlaD